MKKTTKILSLLMALVMIFSLTTVSFAEASDWNPLTDPDTVAGDYVGSKTFTATRSLDKGENGELKVMPILSTVDYSFNAMAYCGVTAVSNNTDVVEVKTKDDHQDIVIGKWQGGVWDDADCLQVNVNAKEAGTAKVTINFYYTFSQTTGNPFKNVNAKWYYGTMYYTVNVTDSVVVPDEPTEYTVTYTDGVDGAAFADQTYTVKEGDATPAFKGTPAREGYVFLGWEPEVAETVTGNATYTAQWEEALTEVKVTANKGEGALLFLGDEIKVTVKTNVKADNIKITPTLNGAFTQVASDTAADGTKTIWYRVTKIIGNYTTLSFTATATKGDQPAVTDTLSFGVNLRNRIHVTVTKKVGGETVKDASVQLMHKYPKWNTCPMLKFDAAKNEYVMKNAWDLSNQEYNMVNITIGDKTYSVNKTSDGRDLMSVVRAGTEEIYVNYVVVDPIKVTINVDGKVAAQHEFEGNDGDTLDYSKLFWAVMDELRAAGATPSVTIAYDNGATAAVFGQCTNVTVNIMTNGTGITGSGEDFPWDTGKTITASGDDFVWGN